MRPRDPAVRKRILYRAPHTVAGVRLPCMARVSKRVSFETSTSLAEGRPAACRLSNHSNQCAELGNQSSDSMSGCSLICWISARLPKILLPIRS